MLKLVVAVVKFCLFKAPTPTATDALPKVSVPKDSVPIATLKSASVNASPARPPIMVFSMPVVIAVPDA